MDPNRRMILGLKDLSLSNYKPSVEIPQERYKYNAIRILREEITPKSWRRKKTFMEDLWRSWDSGWATRDEENSDIWCSEGRRSGWRAV